MAFDIIRSWEHIRDAEMEPPGRLMRLALKQKDFRLTQIGQQMGGRGELGSSPGKLVWTGGRGWLDPLQRPGILQILIAKDGAA